MIILYAILIYFAPIILILGVKYLRLPKDSTIGDLLREGYEDPPMFMTFVPIVNMFLLVIYTGMSIVEALTEGNLSKIKIK